MTSAPFKPHRPSAMNTTSTSGVPTLAKPKQRSTSSTTAAHRPPPRAESTTTTSTESTLSTIRSPSSNHQKQALLQMPVMTQAVKLPMRFRRGKSQVKDIDWTFKSVFHKVEYKGRQQEIMEASLLGSDILVIAPTGMGKSLCFQVPAVAETHGLTLVVSPLLSLMQDQVSALEALSIPCAMLSSKTSPEEAKLILADMHSGHPKNRLLYITPERLSSPHFKKTLLTLHRQQELNRLVIDEAHCISEWGHDFRPEYAKLGNFRCDFPKVPIMALTASATPKVQDDIVNELALDLELLFKVVHPFNRPNLFYEVRYFSEREEGPSYRSKDILAFINRTLARSQVPRMSGIIYCRAKKTCDELAAFLRGNGIAAAPYHRGLKDSDADTTQSNWVRNDELAEAGKGGGIDCIVATIAFGMGIDKSNCRYVIHFDIPKSFEGYYQETGRAGRDGHASRCVLYYSAEDKARINNLVGKSFNARQRRGEQGYAPVPSQRAPDSISALLAYAENVKLCRHVSICRYFGEKVNQDDAASYCSRLCDVCKNPERVRQLRDDGLISLDFDATQAVVARAEDDFDPDDFYEEVDPCLGRGGSQESDDMEQDETEQPRKPRREGFRSAAVQMERMDEDERRKSETDDRSSSPVVLEDYEAPLKGLDDDDDDDQIPSPAQPSHRPHTAVLEELSSSPGLPPDQITLESSDSDGEVEIVPDPPASKKENHPRGVVSVPVKKNDKKAQDKPRGVMGKLPPVNVVGKSNTFVSPFTDPTKNPKHRDRPFGLKTLGDSASSVSDEPPGPFEVSPLTYEKKIPVEMRKEAIVHFVKHLNRAFLSNHGIRSSDSEERVWKELGAPKTTHDQRRNILLAAALDLESDLFWSALTALGFRSYLAPRTAAIKILIRKDDPLPKDEGDVVAAIRRAVVVAKVKTRGTKRKAVVAEDESE